MSDAADNMITAACRECEKTKIINELKAEKGYWEKQHSRAKEKVEKLEAELIQLHAENKYLKQKKYGRSSEQSKYKTEKSKNSGEPEKKKRGGQPGAKGNPRRDYTDLPKKTEYYDVADTEKICPTCGKLYAKFKTTDDSTILEIKVKAYRRVIKKHRYAPSCSCQKNIIITARGPENLFKGGRIGISVWTELLYRKYSLGIPTNRTLKDFKSLHLDIPPGTVGDGMKRLTRLFTPIYQALIAKNQESDFFQADETRWSVFEQKGEKKTFRWYLWLFITRESVVHVIDPTRAAKVIEDHLGEVHEGILVVDRYSAYKSFAKKHQGILLAFCWAHCRRDFLDSLTKYPDLQTWVDAWIEDIATLYRLNNERIRYETDSLEFKGKDKELRTAVSSMKKKAANELEEKKIHHQKKAVLTSLQNHWEGLMVFVDNPHVPMDNNKSERTIRNSVIGRKNYFGSGTEWSAEMAAALFSIFETLKLNKKNEREWLNHYLTACAINNGNVPENIEQFLPWLKESKYQKKKTAASKPIPLTQKTDPHPIVNKKAGDFIGLDFRQPQNTTEIQLWNEYIDRYHYLGHTPLPGERIRYFVYSEDVLVALMGFNSAAWQVEVRDKLIGWGQEQREKNLRYIVNNARFLILPWIKSRNLASRILSLCSKQLVIDWESAYSYRPLMLETFVDSERFDGTCYKASNWINAGMTKGRGRFDHHNKAILSKKHVFLFPLQKNFRSLLA